MAKARRSGNRRSVNIWPSFVDALSTLVLVIVFALMIFVVAQQVLSNALDDTERSRSALSARVASLTGQLASEQDERTQLGNRLGQLQSQFNNTATQLEQARDDLAVTRIRNNELLAQLGETSANAQSLETERSNNRAVITSLRSQVADLNDLSNSQDNEISQLNRRNMELLGMLDQTEESERARSAQVVALQETRTSLEGRIASNQQLMLDIQARLATLLQTQAEQDGDETETALLLSSTDLRDDLTIGVNATSQLYDQITQLVATTQTRLETLLRARDQALARFEAARTQAEENKQQLDSTKADLNSTIDLLGTTRNALTRANQTLDSAQAQQAESSATIALLERELSDQVTVLGNQVAVRDSQLNDAAAEISAYKDQLFVASEEIATLIAQVDAQSEATTEAQAQREAVSAELVDAFEKIAASEAEVSIMAADLDNFARLRRILETQVDGLRAERQSLQAELEVARGANGNLGRRLSSALSELDLLRDGASQLEATNAAAENTLSELVRQLTAVENARDLAIVSAQEAQLLREQEGIQLVEAESRIEALQAQVAQLLARMDSSNRRQQIDQSQLVSQAEEIQVLETRLTSLEVSLALAEQVDELIDYRSEFFGTLSRALENSSEVQLVGERFVLPSEVLFETGATQLSNEGEREINRIGQVLADVTQNIPTTVDWILRIDGHTDRQPLAAGNPLGTNWRLSTERALAVSDLLVSQGFPPERLAVTGFGEHQPLVDSNTPAAFRQNRRIELRLVQR